jgi:hypothetical protein
MKSRYPSAVGKHSSSFCRSRLAFDPAARPQRKPQRGPEPEQQPQVRPVTSAHFLLAVFLLAVVVSAVAGCGDNARPPVYAATNRVASLCTSSNAPAECSIECGASNPFCPDGFFCGSNGTCDAECSQAATSGSACDDTEVCTFNGRCSIKASDNQCATVRLDIKRVVPNVALLIDQSGSMAWPLEIAKPYSTSNPPRWDLIRDFMIGSSAERTSGTSGGLIYGLQKDVKFSIALYTADWYSTPDTTPRTDDCPAMSWPIVQNTPYRTPILNSYGLISSFYSSASPLAATPTGPALLELANSLHGMPLEGPKIIILATDGEPDTCNIEGVTFVGDSAEIEAQKRAVARAEAVQAAQAALGDGQSPGIQTFVIGVGPDTSNEHLQTLANAGTGVESSPYWKINLGNIAGARAELAAAFRKIIYPFVSCTLELSKQVQADQACAGTVKLNGATESLSCGGDDGWALTEDATHIELKGAACEEFRRPLFDDDPKTNPEVEVDFPCAAVLTL